MNLQDVLNNAQAEADQDAASKGGGYINKANLAVGEHKVRLFLEPNSPLFYKWKTKWAGKGHEADPRQFEECPEGLASRITTALATGHDELPKSLEFYKNDFWENLYAYMYIVETDVKDNKYFKAGNLYCVAIPYYVRDAILAGITKAYEKERNKEEMEESLDITKEGIVLEIEIKKKKQATCFADCGGDKVAAIDLSEYKDGQFRPLDKFFTYNEEAGLRFAEEIETNLAELQAKVEDKDDAQTPPEDDDSTSTTETKTTSQSEGEPKAGGKPF